MPIDRNYLYQVDDDRTDLPQHYWYDRRQYLPDTRDLYPQALHHVCIGDIVLILKGVNKGKRGKVTGFTAAGKVKIVVEDATQAAIVPTGIKLLDPEHILGNATPVKSWVAWRFLETEPTGELPDGHIRVIRRWD